MGKLIKEVTLGMVEWANKHKLYAFLMVVFMLLTGSGTLAKEEYFEKKYEDRMEIVQQDINTLKEDNLEFKSKVDDLDKRLANIEGKIDVLLQIATK